MKGSKWRQDYCQIVLLGRHIEMSVFPFQEIDLRIYVCYEERVTRERKETEEIKNSFEIKMALESEHEKIIFNQRKESCSYTWGARMKCLGKFMWIWSRSLEGSYLMVSICKVEGEIIFTSSQSLLSLFPPYNYFV